MARLLVLLVALSAWVWNRPAIAQGELELAVKATYLIKLPPFVVWPSAEAEFPGDVFVVCVVGRDPFGSLLDRAARDQTVAGHQVVVRRYSSVPGPNDCSVEFIGGGDSALNAAMIAAVRNQPVLTVTDQASDPALKGIINFVIAGSRVRFEISETAAAVSGLNISSKLLALAVSDRSHEGTR